MRIAYCKLLAESRAAEKQSPIYTEYPCCLLLLLFLLSPLMHCLRVQQLVALLSALQALHALSMHFLSHLLITRLLLLRSSLVFDPLNMALLELLDLLKIILASHQASCIAQSSRALLTCRSASFSSFISFSSSFTAFCWSCSCLRFS